MVEFGIFNGKFKFGHVGFLIVISANIDFFRKFGSMYQKVCDLKVGRYNIN